MPSLTRRALPASAAVLALLGAGSAQAAGNPDAELLAIGAEAAPLIADHVRFAALWWATSAEAGDAITAQGQQMEPVASRIFELMNRAMGLRATTLQGAKVKAMLIRESLRIEHETEGEMVFTTSDNEAVWALVTDLLAMGAPA